LDFLTAFPPPFGGSGIGLGEKTTKLFIKNDFKVNKNIKIKHNNINYYYLLLQVKQKQ